MKRNRSTILVVDDSADDYLAISRAFSRCDIKGLELEHSRSGDHALQRVCGTEIKPELPDLLLLDLNMPGRNGLQVLKEIRDNQRAGLLPIVVMTNSLNPTDIEDCYRAGANSFIQKPMEFGSLVSVAAAIHKYWFEVSVTLTRAK